MACSEWPRGVHAVAKRVNARFVKQKKKQSQNSAVLAKTLISNTLKIPKLYLLIDKVTSDQYQKESSQKLFLNSRYSQIGV